MGTEGGSPLLKDSVFMQERRFEVRYSLNGLIPIRLMSQDMAPVVAMFIDASSRGLGIIVEPKLRVDEHVTLKLSTGLELDMMVRWIKKPIGFSTPDTPIFHRAGLCLTNPSDIDIVRLLEQYDCVDH